MQQPNDKPRKLIILIVDDEEDIRTVLEKRLFTEGYDVEVAANGKHALTKMQSGKTFDLILCDMRMPVMDGAAFLANMRKMGVNSPVIMITSGVDRATVKNLATHDLYAFCLKPFKYTDLVIKIRQILASGDATFDKN